MVVRPVGKQRRAGQPRHGDRDLPALQRRRHQSRRPLVRSRAGGSRSSPLPRSPTFPGRPSPTCAGSGRSSSPNRASTAGTSSTARSTAARAHHQKRHVPDHALRPEASPARSGTATRARGAPTRIPTRTARSGRPTPPIRLYMRHWGALVTAAGARYDGHPDLDSVDVSTVGYWGEGWGPYLPDWPTRRRSSIFTSMPSAARRCS